MLIAVGVLMYLAENAGRQQRDLSSINLPDALTIGVAQALVIYRKRPGGQAQFSRFLEAEGRQDRLGELQLWILDHLEEDLPLDRLAAAAGMSARHFSRRFKAELGAP